jgi:20S proteasome subunit alpha 4
MLPSPSTELTHPPNRKANAIGRSSKTVREFLERHHKDDLGREATISLTVKSLLEVVQTGAKNIEIAIMAPGRPVEMLPAEQIEAYVKTIEAEKQEEAAKKKPGSGGAGSKGAAAEGTAAATATTTSLPTRPGGDAES